MPIYKIADKTADRRSFSVGDWMADPLFWLAIGSAIAQTNGRFLNYCVTIGSAIILDWRIAQKFAFNGDNLNNICFNTIFQIKHVFYFV
jgi:hypothetical protein